MLIKAGVDISRLKRCIRKKLPVIAKIIDAIAKEELVITSTYEGNHSEGSLHYCDEAADIRRPSKPDAVVREIKRELGPDYDVILYNALIHIEYDPK
jgi:hypothetical protein